MLLAALLVGGRLCHVHILWEGDTLPLAAAAQMAHGKALYHEVWYDKPPLVPAFYLLSGARPGWGLRLEDALYALLACWIAYRFARDLWTEREGLWAAGLLGFFLVFNFPSAVIPVASDLLMLAPHLGAVWMAYRRKPFWSGALAAAAFWISPKGLLVAAVCALWLLAERHAASGREADSEATETRPTGVTAWMAGIAWMAAGFAAASAVVAGWLGATGALGDYWQQVWVWGRLYAGSTSVEAPARNALARTVNWAGFHAAAVIAAGRFLKERAEATERVRWLGWLAISVVGVALGLRFFPRYYFQLLPVVVLMAARGFTLMRPRVRDFVALLLLIPASRFGPAYLSALTDPSWRDIAMDQDSRAVAAFVRGRARPGDTLFIWGYRPEIYLYTGLPAGTIWLDSQPLTGVPADRHLTQSEPVEREVAAGRRAELARTRPDWVLDGIGPYNPRLAVTRYPDLREWMRGYRVAGTVGMTVVWERVR